jgi:hypothetical protein
MTTATRALRQLPLLTAAQVAGLRPDLGDVIEYRKSGLSLNHVVGRPLKTPSLVMSDEQAVQELLGHRYFRPHTTPLQLFGKTTDPMLPDVKPHTFHTLRLLDGEGLTNHLLLTTRWQVTPEDCQALNQLRNLKITVLVAHSGITHPGIEPVDPAVAAASLRTLFEHAERYRVVLSWRPIVPGLNDTDAHISRAVELSAHAHATVFTGLSYRDGIAAHCDATDRREVVPEALEERILDAFHRPDDQDQPWGPLFRKTSCAVAYAHQLADYNGHYSIPEVCDICPLRQLERCEQAWKSPDVSAITRQSRALGAVGPVEVTDRAVLVSGLAEHSRYFLQHDHGYQVHDRAHPHWRTEDR